MSGGTERRGVEGACVAAEEGAEAAEREYLHRNGVRMCDLDVEVMHEAKRMCFVVEILEFGATLSAVARARRGGRFKEEE